MKTSRQNTSVLKRFRATSKVPYLISTRYTNRDCKIMSEPNTNANAGSSNANAESVNNVETADRPINDFQETVNFKLPNFWNHNPAAWIDLIESKFKIANIENQLVKYVAVLECLNKTEIESLYKIPKSDDPECYDKLISHLEDFFGRDNREELDLLLNNLTLGDKTPNELMKHLIAVSGIENDPSPQFETVLKDKFLRALPSDIASSSGIWTYQNLRELAQCATNAMNAAQRYQKNSCPVLTNISQNDSRASTSFFYNENNPRQNFVKHQPSTKGHFRPQNRKTGRDFKNFTPTPNKQRYGNFIEPSYAQSYVCYYHRRFRQRAIKCEGPVCRFFSPRSQTPHLNCQGRQPPFLQ